MGGELRLHDGQDDTDGRPFPSLLTSTLCPPETAPFSPGIITTSSKYLYITFETEDDSNNFKLAWKAVTVSCCSSVTVSSTWSEVLDHSLLSQMLGTYTNTAGEEVNGGPIYTKDSTYYF